MRADEKALAPAQNLENSGDGINGWKKRLVGAAGSRSRFWVRCHAGLLQTRLGNGVGYLTRMGRGIRNCRRGESGLRLGGWLLAFAGAVHELVDAGLEAAGAVGEEEQVRNVPDAEALLELKANVALGGFEAGNRVLLGLRDIGDVAIDGDVYASGFCAGIERDLANVTEADAGIGKLALNHDTDLEAQGLGHPILMMLARAVFEHGEAPGARTMLKAKPE